MDWISLAAAAAVAVAVIALLGLPAALALRLRGFAAVVVAVPAAFAVLAVASIVAPFAGIRWSILPPLALTAALSLLLLVLRRWLVPSTAGGARRDSRSSSLRIPLSAAAIGGGAIAIALMTALGSPGAVSQTFDATFHLNAVRYVLDTGSASPFDMDLAAPGSTAFYPTLWHAFVALVAQLSGASVPLATNASLFAVTAVVWPIGAVALGRAVAGPSRRVAFVSGALAAAFPNFPLFLSGYGVIYPNLLSLALLPFALVAALQLLALGPARRAMPLAPFTRWLFLLGALGAAVIAHPNALHVLVVWGAAPVLWAAWRAWRGRPIPTAEGLLVQPAGPRSARRVAAAVGVLGFGAAAVGAWIVGRTSDDFWEGSFGFRRALIEVAGSTPNLEGHAWAVSVLVLAGALLAWRHRSLRWAVGSAAALALCYYLADGFPDSALRSLVLNPWYNDPRRLAALIPFGALPLAALGASAAWSLIRPTALRLARARSRRPGRTMAVIGALALLLLVGIGQGGAVTAQKKTGEHYDAERAVLLSGDERRLLERLPDEVPEGAVIANNGLNGSALAYALADREVLFPHGNGRYAPRYYELVNALADDPAEACAIAAELDVEYVLDFGDDYVFEDDPNRERLYEGMHDLDRSSVLDEVDREGDAALFRLSC